MSNISHSYYKNHEFFNWSFSKLISDCIKEIVILTETTEKKLMYCIKTCLANVKH